MTDLKTFEVAARPQGDAPNGTQFLVPDLGREGKEQTFTTVTAYEPDEGQFAVLMATTGRGTSDADRIAGFINFFVNILDEKGADYLTGRLLTPMWKDPFGVADVERIMDYLSEQWTGNPTQGSSGSTPSPSTAGPRSTGSILT